MPQTLLALLALVLSSLLVFNHQQLAVRSQQTLVANEVEMAATGLASEILEFAGARSFDENTTPGAIETAGGAVPSDPTAFSATGTFGTAGTCDLLRPTPPDAPGGCDDLDDLDDDRWIPVAIAVSLTDSLRFEARTSVYYVDSATAMDRSTAKTRHKRVVLDLRSLEGRDLVRVRVTRVFSYDPDKALKDHEAGLEP